MKNENDILEWLQLSLLPGFGPVGAARLVSRFGSPGRVLGASAEELIGLGGVRRTALDGLSRIDEFRHLARRQLAGISDIGGEIIVRTDSRYPKALAQIPDPPLVLYALGNIQLLTKRTVAIVGSRSATTYGRRVARQLGGQLSGAGVCIASGMALGIDTQAHQGALQGEGSTVAVLGCGIDVVYPSQNRDLYTAIGSEGLLVSEYPMGTKPEGFRFPARNRIIAGISDGVVVVEAARKSGSLITAQLALDFGREVFAVPGQIDSVKSEGTHWLLRQGAKLVAGGEDVLEELQFAGSIGLNGPSKGGNTATTGLDPEVAALLSQLEPYPLSRDEVLERTGIMPSRLSELFLLLEIEGYIEMLTGDLVRRLSE